MPMKARAAKSWPKFFVRAQAAVARPQYGHDADALFPAPAVDDDGNGEGEKDDSPVDGGNHRPALGVGQTPVGFQEGKERDHHHPVDVVKKIEEPE
jgi:hypothetical protein